MTQPDAPATLGFQHFATREPSIVAVVNSDGTSRSRGELSRQANQIARALVAAGVAPGEAIAALGRNSAEYLAVYFAAMQIGAYFVPINWHLRESEIVNILRTARVRLVVADAPAHQDAYRAVMQCRDQLLSCIAWSPNDDFPDIGDFIATFDDTPLRRPQVGRVMSFTSATTGVPKCVVRTLAGAAEARDSHLRVMARLHEDAGIQLGASTHLCQSMLCHPVPLSHSVTALNLGHRVILMDRWDPEDALRLIDCLGVESTFMVPSMFVRLLGLPDTVRSNCVTSSLRLVTHGGAPTPQAVKWKMLAWWGNVIHELYGARRDLLVGLVRQNGAVIRYRWTAPCRDRY